MAVELVVLVADDDIGADEMVEAVETAEEIELAEFVAEAKADSWTWSVPVAVLIYAWVVVVSNAAGHIQHQ